MSHPYRTPAESPRTRLAFGGSRQRKLEIAAGFLVIAVTGILFSTWPADHPFIGFLMLLSFLGVGLIVSAQWGTMELRRDEDRLLVELRRVAFARRHDVTLSDLRGVEVTPVMGRGRQPNGWQLQLQLGAGRRLLLRRASSHQELEGDQVAIAAFLAGAVRPWVTTAAPPTATRGEARPDARASGEVDPCQGDAGSDDEGAAGKRSTR